MWKTLAYDVELQNQTLNKAILISSEYHSFSQVRHLSWKLFSLISWRQAVKQRKPSTSLNRHSLEFNSQPPFTLYKIFLFFHFEGKFFQFSLFHIHVPCWHPEKRSNAITWNKSGKPQWLWRVKKTLRKRCAAKASKLLFKSLMLLWRESQNVNAKISFFKMPLNYIQTSRLTNLRNIKSNLPENKKR